MKNKGKINDNNPFRVPGNYFDKVKRDIYEKTRDDGDKKVKTGISVLFKPVIMMAAAMLAFVIISYSMLKLLFPEYNKADEHNFSELIYNFDEAELIDKLVGEKHDEDSLPAEESEIINYLMDNDIEYYTIIEYLN
ncbi:MAG TPA: hypothetical protein ENH59_01980 [Bacteroidetes bacterium]|nr:hypothetical protein [Bacteroidota bacterium]